MSALPSPTKVAGIHFPIYESYYNLVDPNNHGHIEAMDAAQFLKNSNLSDVILSKIWDLADPNSRGYLDKPGMFVALKLCALAQQGHNLNISNIYMEAAPPKMGDKFNTIKMNSCIQSKSVSINDVGWSISQLERTKYEQLFHDLEPVNGYIPGNKVKGLLMDSKLPLETLGKIWDLADIDKDGKLNVHEFTIAMHLVYKALEKHAIPSVLPPELLKISSSIINSTPNISTSVCSLETTLTTTSLPSLKNETNFNEWVVSEEDQIAADKLFFQADDDQDGFVSGIEIKEIFFQSGLSQSVLAHIWNLCDISQSGKLNKQQFALSMWLIKQKINGTELPTKLLPEMIPPSLKPKLVECILDNNNLCSYSNPELNMISKDIAEIIREKHTMEQDISQKEADIKIKNGEIKSLQSELDTLAATLRQLDNQKGEAQKRLNDLKTQVDKLRQQATDQESTLHIQEDALNSKRQEIENIKLIEHKLEIQQNEYKNQLQNLSKQLQNIQLQTSQIKAKMTQLEEQQQQIVNVVTQYDSAITVGDASIVPDSYLLFTSKIEDMKLDLSKFDGDADVIVGKVKNHDVFNNNEKMENQDCFSTFNKYNNYHESDPFEAEFEPKKSETINVYNSSNKNVYDPFNDEASKKNVKPDLSQVQDPFGEDPFAALHAPIRSESPSPALPPKKSKQPPPRPAPPRPALGPQCLSQRPLLSSSVPVDVNSDPFADKMILSTNSSNNAQEFADFANFDSKPSKSIEDSSFSKKIDDKTTKLLITKNIADFEEDPFLNYRYEDLSTIFDPFNNNEA